MITLDDLFNFKDSSSIDQAIQKATILRDLYDQIVSDLSTNVVSYQNNIKKIQEGANSLLGTVQNLNAETSEQQQQIAQMQPIVDAMFKSQKQLTDEQVRSEQELKKAKTTRDQAAKSTKVLSDQTASLKLQQREANQVQKLSAQLDLSKAGSVEELRAKLGLVTIEWKKLSRSERENTDQGRAIVATKKQLTEELKKVSNEAGDTRLNVGNYTESIKDALSQTTLLGGAFGEIGFLFQRLNILLSSGRNILGSLAGGFKNAASATTLTSKALRILRLALISTGIGALVVALGSVVAFLTKTQRGMDLVGKAATAVGTAFDVIIDRLSGFGDLVVQLFSGNLSINSFLTQTKENFSGVGDEIQREVRLALELEEAFNRLRDAEIGFITQRAELNKEVEKSRLLAKDENASNQERLDALDRALDLEDQRLQKELEFARERARISQGQLDLAESTREEFEENAKVQARVIELETATLKRQRTIQSERLSLINKLRREQEAAAKARADQVEKLLQAEDALNKFRIDQDIKTLDLIADNQDNEISRRLKAIEDASQLRIQVAEIERDALLRNTKLSADERTLIIEQFNAKVKELNESADSKIEVTVIANDERIRKDVQEAARQIRQLIGEETAKLVDQISIDTSNLLIALGNSFQQGLISAREFEAERLRIIQEGQRKALNAQIDSLQAQLDNLDLSAKARLDIEEKIAKARLELNQQTTEDLISNAEAEREALDKIVFGSFEALSSSLQGFNDIANQRRQERITALDQELADQLKLVGDNQEARVALEAQFELRREALRRNAIAAQRRQAVFQKGIDAAQSIASTARAFAETLVPSIGGPPPLNFINAGIVGAAGALRTAIILSQPIPQFKHGTRNAPGGAAIINDGGKSELVVTPKGELKYDPQPTPKLVFLEPGSTVFKGEDTEKIFKGDASKLMESQGIRRRYRDSASALQELQNAGFVDQGGGQAVSRSVDRLRHTIASKKELHINFTEQGVQKLLSNAQGITELFNTAYK